MTPQRSRDLTGLFWPENRAPWNLTTETNSSYALSPVCSSVCVSSLHPHSPLPCSSGVGKTAREDENHPSASRPGDARSLVGQRCPVTRARYPRVWAQGPGRQGEGQPPLLGFTTQLPRWKGSAGTTRRQVDSCQRQWSWVVEPGSCSWSPPLEHWPQVPGRHRSSRERRHDRGCCRHPWVREPTLLSPPCATLLKADKRKHARNSPAHASPTPCPLSGNAAPAGGWHAGPAQSMERSGRAEDTGPTSSDSRHPHPL